MKYLKVLSLLTLCLSYFSNAQEFDPQLFQTWDLIEIFDSEGNLEHLVTDIDPNITARLVIFPSSSFYGQGACNTFSGDIGFDANNQSIITDFDANDSDCNNATHNSFETTYFNFFSNIIQNNSGIFNYEITPSADGFGLLLVLSAPNSSSLVFRNYTIPDSQIFQTWYLVQTYETEGNPEYIIDNIEPEIAPVLTLNNDSTFNGIAACNDYSGTILYLPTNDNINSLLITNLTNGTTTCDSNIHNNFETTYFGFLNDEGFSSFYYEITPSSDGLGLELVLNSLIFNGLIYRNYQLSISEEQFQNIQLTYNSAYTIIYIKDPNHKILNIDIYNISGLKIKTVKSDSKSIDIASLAKGIYLARIETNSETMTKKIIKK